MARIRNRWTIVAAVAIAVSTIAYAAAADDVPDAGDVVQDGGRPIPVEPDSGIGDTPIPVEPDSGIGDTSAADEPAG